MTIAISTSRTDSDEPFRANHKIRPNATNAAPNNRAISTVDAEVVIPYPAATCSGTSTKPTPCSSARTAMIVKNILIVMSFTPHPPPTAKCRSAIANRAQPFRLCKKTYPYERIEPRAAAPHHKGPDVGPRLPRARTPIEPFNNVGVLRPDMTNSRPSTRRSLNAIDPNSTRANGSTP
jgi:hypothetical protein